MEHMLRPQDIYILFALCGESLDSWTYDSLSEHLGMSKSETYRSLDRSATSHLFDAGARRVRRAELLEFVVHGMRYAFAVTPGASARGMPTCWDAPGLEDHLVVDELESYVWPHPRGTHRGRAVEPLHDAVIFAAGDDPVLHRRLALCDAIRLGGARERKLAARLLEGGLER
jgi:hypothetical protein